MTGEKVFYITKEGLEKIKEEYEALKNLRQAKTGAEAPKILESEDLNPEYISFQEDLVLLETRINEIENVLKNIAIIEPPKTKQEKDVVGVGSKILVEIDGKEKDEFTIVGALEANPSLGKISNESPVGHALLNHKVGDKITISSPIKTVYKIKKIKYNIEKS
jgi:transcription elongation factor GreA